MNGEFLAPNGFWEIEGEPYTTAPGSSFRWFRSRIEGGRTNHYGRISLRVSPADLKARSRDGLGDDWPITYEELAPYYDKVEEFIGVFGTKENLVDAPDGVFLPPPKPRCTETLVKKACDHLNITCIPSRMAMLTKSVNGRAPCHYCAQCGRGCISASNFSSSQVMIPPAQATGRFTLIPNAMAREILVGKDGKAQAVSYIDKTTPKEMRVNARSFVVAASACETARLLLNSRSALFPDGLANSSGTAWPVSHRFRGYQCDRIFPSTGGSGSAQSRWYWWYAHVHAVVETIARTIFLRGYHIEFGGGRHMPGCRPVGRNMQPLRRVWTRHSSKTSQSMYGTFIGFAGRGEMIPYPDTFCEIDPKVVDKWGIPVLRFHFAWSDHEIKMAKDMQETFTAIVEAGGGTVFGGGKRDPAMPQNDLATGGRPYGISEGRRNHSRAGNGAHGRRSQDFSPQ